MSKKTGLILEGGAMRGMFTAGVLDVMMEHKMAVDGAIGVSAGAVFGCNYKSGQIGRVIRYNTRYSRDKRYGGFGVFLKTGNFYSTDFCYGELPLNLDVFDIDAYKKNSMEFYVVCTDTVTGEPVYHKYEGYEDHGLDWLRASASMPLVSRMVEIDGQKLLDGGIADSIPIKYFESIGYEKNIVVLTQPKDYVKKKNSLIPLAKLRYKEYPKLIEAMANRHLDYNASLEYIEKKEAAGEILVIRPKQALPISRTEKDPEKLRAVYEIGRKAAEEKLREMKQFLE